MHRDPRAFLWDASESAAAIVEFARGRTFDDYVADRMVRSAMEREFEIIGEALSQLSKLAPDIAQRIPELAQAVGFRNVLIHGYAAVNHATVWRTIHEDLPRLHDHAVQLLSELSAS